MNGDSTPPTTKNQVGPEIKYGHGPLYGVKVLDITRFWNGPSAKCSLFKVHNLSEAHATPYPCRENILYGETTYPSMSYF